MPSAYPTICGQDPYPVVISLEHPCSSPKPENDNASLTPLIGNVVGDLLNSMTQKKRQNKSERLGVDMIPISKRQRLNQELILVSSETRKLLLLNHFLADFLSLETILQSLVFR